MMPISELRNLARRFSFYQPQLVSSVASIGPTSQGAESTRQETPFGCKPEDQRGDNWPLYQSIRYYASALPV